MSTPVAAFIPANMDGCALYRHYIPHLNIPGSRFIWIAGAVPYAQFAEADVVVVQRQLSSDNFIALSNMKNMGLHIMYDTDDNLWTLPSANPMKKIFEKYESGIHDCMMLCDTITVSTKGLRTAVRSAVPRFPGEILVCPNSMDFTLFPPSSVERDTERVVIGWAGSNTHDEDVLEVWNVLPGIVDANPNVYMEFIGTAPPQKLIGHPRVRMRRFFPVGEWPSRFASWGWDITIAPLTDNRFNRSKSNIKMLEAAALHIPCLVSPVQPYEEFCALGDLKWLLCRSENAWHSKLTDLIADASLRKEMAGRVRTVAETWFNVKKMKDNWIHAIETAAA